MRRKSMRSERVIWPPALLLTKRNTSVSFITYYHLTATFLIRERVVLARWTGTVMPLQQLGSTIFAFYVRHPSRNS